MVNQSIVRTGKILTGKMAPSSASITHVIKSMNKNSFKVSPFSVQCIEKKTRDPAPCVVRQSLRIVLFSLSRFPKIFHQS